MNGLAAFSKPPLRSHTVICSSCPSTVVIVNCLRSLETLSRSVATKCPVLLLLNLRLVLINPAHHHLMKRRNILYVIVMPSIGRSAVKSRWGAAWNYYGNALALRRSEEHSRGIQGRIRRNQFPGADARIGGEELGSHDHDPG